MLESISLALQLRNRTRRKLTFTDTTMLKVQTCAVNRLDRDYFVKS